MRWYTRAGGDRPTLVQWAQLLLVSGVLLWSAIEPIDRKVWVMETVPVFLGLVAVIWRWRAFPWTPLATVLITIFALVLCVGGKYTYGHVPLGEWMRGTFELERNHYDRIGHFLQGFVPAILAREVLLRRTPLRQGKALFWLVCSIALSTSAAYELIEWWAAIIAAPDQGIAFLGSQGDEWDAQWDMTCALAGSILVQLTLVRLHDRQLAVLVEPRLKRAKA
jgi:putative membrane protein